MCPGGFYRAELRLSELGEVAGVGTKGIASKHKNSVQCSVRFVRHDSSQTTARGGRLGCDVAMFAIVMSLSSFLSSCRGLSLCRPSCSQGRAHPLVLGSFCVKREPAAPAANLSVTGCGALGRISRPKSRIACTIHERATLLLGRKIERWRVAPPRVRLAD
jgi:hypothetical protein